MDGRVFQHRGEFALRQVGSESILVPIRNHVGDLDSVYVFNAVGAQIWPLLDGSHDLESIVAIICDEYDAEPAVVRADLEELLGSLEAAGLIAAAVEAKA
jgi:hypothetical protein